MRLGLVMVLVCLAACGESRYGAYLVVEGDIEFDEVELYFGVEIDSSGTGSGNQFATPMLGQQSGDVFARKFDASDAVTLTPTQQTTFYLPPDQKNQQLGAYAVAVALRGGSPVGIAELFSFEVPSDVVHEYHLKVTAWNATQMERWGERPGCVAWKQPRDGHDPIAAVVRDDDRDCDGLPADMDCSDLCSAQASSCGADQTLCNTGGVCALGCNRGGLCAPTLCLPTETCANAECMGLASIDSKLACGRDKTTEHLELLLHRDGVMTSKTLCTRTLTFRPTLLTPPPPCKDPKIEAIEPTFQLRFAPTIAQSQADPASCELHLNGAAVSIGDLDEHHALVSFAPADLGPRFSFVLGVKWSGMDQCSFEGYGIEPAGVLFDCQ